MRVDMCEGGSIRSFKDEDDDEDESENTATPLLRCSPWICRDDDDDEDEEIESTSKDLLF